jgi:hypothetical protein
MYARVTRYRTRADATDVAEQVRTRVEWEFYPRYLVDAPGFRGYFIVDLGESDGGREIAAFSLWETSEAADLSVGHAESYVRERLADLLVETLQSSTGEVFFAR